jgi:hypothetical protein
MAHIKQKMIDRADMGEYYGMWMAHKTDVPLRDAFPNFIVDGRWGGCS